MTDDHYLARIECHKILIGLVAGLRPQLINHSLIRHATALAEVGGHPLMRPEHHISSAKIWLSYEQFRISDLPSNFYSYSNHKRQSNSASEKLSTCYLQDPTPWP